MINSTQTALVSEKSKTLYTVHCTLLRSLRSLCVLRVLCVLCLTDRA